MLPFKYTIKKSKNRNFTTSIQISSEHGVLVRAPHFVPLSQIEAFLYQKKDWVLTQLAKLEQVTSPKKKYCDGEIHLYFGESFPLKITRSLTNKKAKLSLLYNSFEALVPSSFSLGKTSLELRHLFTKWYLKQGKKVITQKVNHFCQLLNVSYQRITLKRVSSIWGSCSRRNNLNFNRKLIQAPHKIVDYVVIHEVCHLIHRHHRKTFWNLVKSLDPDYKDHVKWLKQNSHLLTI